MLALGAVSSLTPTHSNQFGFDPLSSQRERFRDQKKLRIQSHGRRELGDLSFFKLTYRLSLIDHYKRSSSIHPSSRICSRYAI